MPESSNSPIFYDPHNRRWTYFKATAILVILALIAIFSVMTLSVVSTPPLPDLNLASTRTAFQPSHASSPAAPKPTLLPTIPQTPRAMATALPPRTPTPNANQNREQAFQDALNRLKQYLQTPVGQRTPIANLIPSRPAAKITPSAHMPTPRVSPAPAAKRNPKAQQKQDERLRSLEQYLQSQVAKLQARPTLIVRSTNTPVARIPLARATPTPFAPPLVGPRTDSQVIGFFVDWDDTAYTSLAQNIHRLDKIIPEWLHLYDSDGNIVDDDAAKESQVLNLVAAQNPKLAIVPLVNNYNTETGDWEGRKLSVMLANSSARARTIQNLLDFVRNNHLQGISVDFENVPEESQANLRTFMRELYAKFHPLGLEVSQSVPMEDNAYDCRALAQTSDYLILMAYDEHWAGGDPGSVASQSWFANALRQRLVQAPANKYIVGIGNYGYDWTGKGDGSDITFQDATQIANSAQTAITFDPNTLNPTYDYRDDEDKTHHVWYLDAVTAFNQVAQAQQYGVRGYALWRMGSEDPALWSVFDHRNKLDQVAADTLRDLRYGYDIDYTGRGEILKITAEPSDGKREIVYNDKSKMIVDEKMTAYPSPYIVTRWGGKDRKKLALTFDDGPDAQFTPKILDILKQYQVPGTFFIVGTNGDMNSTLLQRIVAEGHEIGNHTFTHPDVSAISPEQLTLELNATQRLFEGRLGLRSVLFRPPYGEDVEPVTPDQVKPLLASSDLGYFTIGMGIDPKDWHNPGVDDIVEETISQADDHEGNIILLHDGGGDRSETVAALPHIIEQLQAKGYQFVTVSDLMGLTRDQVMSPVPTNQRAVASVNDVGFVIVSITSWLIANLFVVGIILGIVRMVFIGFFAVVEWVEDGFRKFPSDFRPHVSVLVPAYNEVKVIANTLNALLKSTYPNLDIIVVDDGSTDGTYTRVVNEFGNHPHVRAFTKSNGGKSAALNFGIQQTQSEIIFAQDADTIILPDAVEKLVRHFTNPRVGAVAGNAKVGNRINLLTKWQALEYITSQNLDRRAFAVLNCMTVVPGAIGAWRRELIIKAGGFTNDTLAEDADLTLKILRAGHRIEYDEEAIALTEAPDTIRGFLKQRFRWMYGTLQAAWKHSDTILRPRYGALGIIAVPNVFIFQVFFPLISPLMDLLLVGSLATWAWQRYQHPNDLTANDALMRVAIFYVLFLVIDFLGAFVAFMLERKEQWSLLFWLFFQRFLYRQLMYYVAIQAVATAMRGRIAGWGKLERKATVKT